VPEDFKPDDELQPDEQPDQQPEGEDAALYTIDRDQPLRRVPIADVLSQVREPSLLQDQENDRRMLEGAATVGELRLRVDLRVYTRAATYTPMLGDSMTIVCRSLEAAKFVRQEMRKFVASLDGVVLGEKEEGGAA